MNHRFLIILPALLYTNINAKVNAVNWMILQDCIYAKKIERVQTSIKNCNLDSFIKHLDKKYNAGELIEAVKSCNCSNKEEFIATILARQTSE